MMAERAQFLEDAPFVGQKRYLPFFHLVYCMIPLKVIFLQFVQLMMIQSHFGLSRHLQIRIWIQDMSIPLSFNIEHQHLFNTLTKIHIHGGTQTKKFHGARTKISRQTGCIRTLS